MFFRLMLIYLALCISVVHSITCNKPTDSCRCDTDEGKVDLSSLDSGSSSSAGLQAQSGTYAYDYNPCTPFSIQNQGGTGCENILGCQTQGTWNWAMADASSFSRGNDGTNLQLTMTHDDGQTMRTMEITLICDQDTEGDLQVTDDSTTTYTFTLTSKCCCPDGCAGSSPPPAGGGSDGISVGTVILIVVLVLVIIYFIGGMLFMHFAKGANGSEMIPNVTFWKAAPGLIKDGTIFVVHKVKGQSGGGYDQI